MAQCEVNLRAYWCILCRRQGILLFAAFLLGFFSFIVSAIWQPVPIYRAEAKVQINAAALGGIPSFFQAYSDGGPDNIEIQMAIMMSYTVIEWVARKLGFLEFATTTEEMARVVLSLPERIQTFQDGHTNIIAALRSELSSGTQPRG